MSDNFIAASPTLQRLEEGGVRKAVHRDSAKNRGQYSDGPPLEEKKSQLYHSKQIVTGPPFHIPATRRRDFLTCSATMGGCVCIIWSHGKKHRGRNKLIKKTSSTTVMSQRATDSSPRPATTPSIHSAVETARGAAFLFVHFQTNWRSSRRQLDTVFFQTHF